MGFAGKITQQPRTSEVSGIVEADAHDHVAWRQRGRDAYDGGCRDFDADHNIDIAY